MIEVGYHYRLTASKKVRHGMYLSDAERDTVLLPAKFCPDELEEGQEVEVFIYTDSQNRPVATTQEPLIQMYGFAILECVDVARFGAFMKWGLDRDLLIPHREQAKPIKPGRNYLTYLFLDEDERITGTTDIDKCLAHDDIDLEVGQEVDLMAYEMTPLGMKVIVDDTYGGLVYDNDNFESINPGDRIKGYVRKVREDKLVDITLRRFGHRKVEDQIDPIIQYLQNKGGHSPLHDKSDPEVIQSELNMSKKVFKKAIGSLYRQRLILIEENGIRLVQ